jgi:hypothetical protein
MTRQESVILNSVHINTCRSFTDRPILDLIDKRGHLADENARMPLIHNEITDDHWRRISLGEGGFSAQHVAVNSFRTASRMTTLRRKTRQHHVVWIGGNLSFAIIHRCFRWVKTCLRVASEGCGIELFIAHRVTNKSWKKNPRRILL